MTQIQKNIPQPQEMVPLPKQIFPLPNTDLVQANIAFLLAQKTLARAQVVGYVANMFLNLAGFVGLAFQDNKKPRPDL